MEANSSTKRPEAMREAEARIRALTREVGTLREDLRREVKRRERAIVQAQEHEEARRISEQRVTELVYSNKKLASELEALHDAARAAAERDRRALSSLREGLAAVEAAVAARAQKGSTQLRVLYGKIQQLRALLFAPSELLANVQAISSAIAPQADALLSDAVTLAAQLAALLSGGGSNPATDNDDTLSQDEQPAHSQQQQQQQAANGAAQHIPGHTQPLSGLMLSGGGMGGGGMGFDMEKEQLKDEVVRLRAEMKTQFDRSAGGVTAAALELQSALTQAQSELLRLKGELIHTNALLAQAHKEASGQQETVQQLQAKLSVQDEAHAAAVNALSSHQTQGLELVAAAEASKAALQEELTRARTQAQSANAAANSLHSENSGLRELIGQKDMQIAHLQNQLANIQADLLAQHADMRSALQLASTSSRQAAHRAQAPAPDTSLAAAVPAPPSHALQQAVSRMELAGLSQSSNALLQGASQYGGQLGASSWAAGGVSSSGSAAAPLRSQHQHQPVIIPPPPAVAGLTNHTTNSYLPLPPGAGAAYSNAHSTTEGVLGQGIGQAQQSPASKQPAWAMPSQRGSSGQGSVGTAAAGSALGHYGSSSSGHGNGNGSALQAAVELVAQQSAAARAAVAAAGGRGQLPPSLALQGAAPPSQGHTQQQRGQQGQSLYVPTHAASVRRLQQQAQEEQQQLAAGSRPSSGDGRGLADDLGPQQQQQYQSEPVRAPRPPAGSYQRGPREIWAEAKATGYLNAANSPSGRYGATHSPGGVVGIHAAGHGGGNSGGGGANGGSIRKVGSRSNKFALLKEDMQTLDHEIAQLEVSLKAAAKRVM